MRLLVLTLISFAALLHAGEHNAGDPKKPREIEKIVPLNGGLIFDGVRVEGRYDGNLRGFDAAANKQIWVTSISYFWTRARIVEKDIDGAIKWLLELHPEANTDRGADKREYRDLRTGKEVVISGPPPGGELLGPAQVFRVSKSALGRQIVTLVSTQENFDAFWARVHGPLGAGKPGYDADLLNPGIDVPGGVRREVMPPPRIDFTQNVALIYHLGDCYNTTGMDQRGIWDDGKRVLIRLHRSGYQTMGRGAHRRFGEVFVLPRKEGRHYEIEVNMQNTIRGPEIWERTELFPPAKGGAEEIAPFAPEYRPEGERVLPGFERVIQHSAPRDDDEDSISSYYGKQTYAFYKLGKRTVMHGPYKQEKKFGNKWISVAEGAYVDGNHDGLWLYRATQPNSYGPDRVPNEAERIRVTYDRGVRHGPYEVIDVNGLKAVVGAYDHGLPNGTWTVTHDDGTKSIYPFVRGLYHGDLQRISAAGFITWKQSYEMGKKRE